MPSLSIHLAVAKKYLENHPEENKEDFIKGTIAPDRCEDRKLSHYGKVVQTDSAIEYLKNKVDLDNYLSSNSLDNSFNRGYFLHLVCDYLFYCKYIKNDVFEGMSFEEAHRIGRDDFNRITPYLVEKYKFEIPAEIEYIINRRSPGELEILTKEVVDNFIEDMSKIDIYNLKTNI